MAVRDIVVLNTTSSRLEVQQSSDTVRILGTSDQLVSIENSSGTTIFGLNAPSSSINIAGSLTASGNFSASIGNSSSSFGRIEATTLVGSGTNLTNTDHGLTIVSSSQQMASEISGAFDSGFEFTGTIGKSVGVFSAGGAMNVATKANGSAGLRNAALSFAGSPNAYATEEYNGSVWSTSNNLSTAMMWTAGAGYLTSALAFGGNSDQDETQKYDGTSWSETGNLILGRYMIYGAGTQNAAIGATGFTPACSPAPFVRCTELFDGSTWSETSDVITGTARGSATGTQNATLIAGGEPTLTCTEEWDGGSWSTGGSLITGRAGTMGIGVSGTVNTSIAIGGSVGTKQCVEEYNGTSWSAGGVLINGRSDGGAAGTQDSAVAFGGCDYPANSSVACTEHYDGFLPVSASFGKVIATTISGDASRLDNTVLAGTVSSSAQIASGISGSFNKGFEFTGTIGKATGVYSTGGNLSVATSFGAGVGVQNAALQIAGGNPVYTCTQKYNGTAWSTGGCIAPAADIRCSNGAFGNYGSAVTFGGFPSPYERTAIWNGSSWSAGPNMGEGKIGTNGAGTMDAGLAMGGYNPGCSPSTLAVGVEEWNGTAWSEGGDLISPNKFGAASGIQNAALWHRASVTEEYDGSAWATGGSMINNRYETQGVSTSGTVNAHVLMGGYLHPANSSCTEEYNGTSWSTANAMPNVSRAASGAGSIDAALHVGGKTPSDTTATLHYDGFLPISASFGKIVATKISGDGSTLSNTLSPGVVTSSAQLASDISGSHTSGFEFTGNIGAASAVWSSGPDISYNYQAAGSAGLRNAALIFGNSPLSAITSHYNGSSWSLGGAMAIGRRFFGGTGTEYAALAVGNLQPISADTEEYYGETWAAGGNLITARAQAKSAGTQNAAVAAGGCAPGTVSCTEEYDGASWSAGGALIYAAKNNSHTGAQNASLYAGSGVSPYLQTQEYDGTSWSESGALSVALSYTAMAGVQDAAVLMGGYDNQARKCVFEYNGQTWSTSTDMITQQFSSGDAGTMTSALLAGGNYDKNCTQHYDSFVASGSFGIVCAETLSGDGSKLQNTIPPNVVSSSTQLATDISGSFDSGFEFTGTLGVRGGVWSAGGALITGRIHAVGMGLQNAALAVGGHPTHQCTEHYNGTSWSSGGVPANGCFGRAGDGTEYAGLVFGGWSSKIACTEEYYGETFAQGGALSTGRGYSGGAGTQNAALGFGGSAPGSPIASVGDCTEHYNGASWSSGGAMISGRNKLAGAGAQNAAIAVGGLDGSSTKVASTEHYDGTAWRTGGDMSDGRRGLSVTGIENAALRVGGEPGDKREVEHYDGVAWSLGASKNDYTHCLGSIAGTRTAGLYFGGGNPSPGQACTEHYESYYASASFGRVDATTIAGSGLGLTNKLASGILSGSAQIANEITGSFIKGVYGITGDITTATGVWSAGGALNIARRWHSRAGTENSALAAGGHPSLADSEEYNGSTWTEGNNMISGRYGAASDGTQNAAWIAGGFDTPARVSCTEHYNGTSWATDEALSAAAVYKAGFGTTNSHIVFGGFTPTTLRQTEEYNGSAYSFGGDMQIARGKHQGAGNSQLSGLSIGGYTPNGNCTEHYDGTAWSAGGATSITRKGSSAAGSENSALVAGSDGTLATEEYDGSVWSSGGTLNDNHRCAANATGTQAAGLYFGGAHPSTNTTCTEHYNSYHLKTGGTCIEHIRTTSTFIESVSGYSSNYYQSGSDAFCGSYYGTMLSGSGVPRNELKRNKQNDKLEVKRSFQMPVFYTDPVTGSAGELWYNAVDNALKFTFDYNAWSAGGALLIDRTQGSYAGSQNAALAAGGYNLGATAATGSVEEYNGSTWSIGGAIPINTRQKVGHGTQNAALAGAGAGNATEQYQYNGTAWSEVADNGTGRCAMGGAGSQNAALIFGAYNGDMDDTEAFNGMSWTEGGNLITGRGYGASGGTVNAAIFAGGIFPGGTPTCTEHYDGTSWSAGGAINNARWGLGGSGTQNAIVIFGSNTYATCTEEYNGTTWSNSTALIKGRTGGSQHQAGSQDSGLFIGGYTNTPANATLTCTEEYSATYVKTVCLDS